MPSMELLGVLDLRDTVVFYYVALAVVVGIYGLTVWMMDSAFGRALVGIRESERRLAFLGFDTNKYKRRAFTISGAIGGIAGVIFFGWVFFLIALPEAIVAARGGSLQDHFPRDARTNPFVEGSMLAMRWYGNFLLLAIVLGVMAGVFLLAL
jgi:hypothetical protein